MTNPLTHAGPNLERGIEFAEDLCVQSFLQHATLFLSSFNTEFVSHAEWRAPDRPVKKAGESANPDTAALESEILSERNRVIAARDEAGNSSFLALRAGIRRADQMLRRFILQVSQATTYYPAYFWKPFPMGNQPGNQPAIVRLSAQFASPQMHLSRIR